jgi:hypothetical protein
MRRSTIRDPSINRSSPKGNKEETEIQRGRQTTERKMNRQADRQRKGAEEERE